MRPCDSIIIRLLAIGSSRPNGQVLQLERQGKHVHEPAVSVQHISNSADYSFIRQSKLQALLLENCDSSFPDIEIDDDTVVVIRWHYPGTSKREVTKHLVVRESRFDIILRKQDWEQPIREFLRHVRQLPFPSGTWHGFAENSTRAHSETTEKSKEYARISPGNDPGAESDIASPACQSLNPTRQNSFMTVLDDTHTEPSSAASCTSEEAGDELVAGQEEKSEGLEITLKSHKSTEDDVLADQVADDSELSTDVMTEADTSREKEVDWGDIQICDKEPILEGPDGMQENSYWDWSAESRRWYHFDNNGICWFPDSPNDKDLLNIRHTSHSWPYHR
ncbi:hypothetical protein BGZ63DRAFT_161393 [Mariannaea sp. PMI_226]|nr:hypothetical protein BGZ63DRAFT_161393 [Mariannaea sp. PMI_226]